MPDRSPLHRERVQQRREYLRRLRWEAAGTIREKYPQVKAIHVTERYLDASLHDLAGSDDVWNIVPAEASPQTVAVFELKCPRRECVEGGFDFTRIIEQTVRTRATRETGRQVCPGWHDEAHYGQERCRTQLAYDITIEYRFGPSRT